MKSMRVTASLSVVALGAALVLGWDLSAARADDDSSNLPRNATFTTLVITPLPIEGLTGDAKGNLYTTGRATPPAPCPVWKVAGSPPSLTVVGFVPSPCGPAGIAFDEAGNLYIADGGAATVWRLTPDEAAPPTATPFATGVPGTNGLAFDEDGNLWTGDGTTGQGRVWRIGPAGGVCETTFTGCVEAFRLQAMANALDPAVSSGVANVGRDARTLPPGTINAARQATNTAGSQPLVANGLAFDRDGDLFVADTARGAVWKVELDGRGNVKSPTGCDETFTANTLCLDNIFVAHTYLEGTDGIALDRAGNVWNSVNERNAIVVVTRDRRAVEIFRNPVNADTRLRNAATDDADNNRILEFPTSPFLSGRRFCTASSDGDRRDNSPRAAGEINGATQGKISCMDQRLPTAGLPVPGD